MKDLKAYQSACRSEGDKDLVAMHKQQSVEMENKRMLFKQIQICEACNCTTRYGMPLSLLKSFWERRQAMRDLRRKREQDAREARQQLLGNDGMNDGLGQVTYRFNTRLIL